MKLFSAISTAIALCCFSAQSYAHHGSNGQFDTSKEIEVSGVVTNIRFVNPHSYVYFDVTNDAGEVDAWRCEMRSGSLLRRTGWSTDMFTTGTKINIIGSPARREPFGCLTQSITFDGGETFDREAVIDDSSSSKIVAVEATLSDGTPNLNGNWVALPRVRPAGGGAMAGGDAMGGGDAMAAGGMAGGGMGGGRGPQYVQTELGKTASEGFNREDNPRFHCDATNLFLDWIFDQHVNTIEQTADQIVITYGFMDIKRTIHLKQNSHPDNIEPSRAGHSIGSWEDGALVVDTVGFESGYLDGTFSGTKHSDEMHVIEHFSLSDDGNTLNRAFTVEDELYLAEKFEGTDSVVRTSAEFESYECEDLTEEIVEGF